MREKFYISWRVVAREEAGERGRKLQEARNSANFSGFSIEFDRRNKIERQSLPSGRQKISFWTFVFKQRPARNGDYNNFRLCLHSAFPVPLQIFLFWDIKLWNFLYSKEIKMLAASWYYLYIISNNVTKCVWI